MTLRSIFGLVALALIFCGATELRGADWVNNISGLAPVGWWQLNETVGPTAIDSSVGGNNGVYMGAPSLNQAPAFGAPSNRSVRFNGSDHVGIGDVLDLGTNSFTLFAWFLKTKSDTSFMKLVNKGLTAAGTPSNAGYQIRIRDGFIESSAVDAAGTSLNVNTTEPLIDEWHFVAAVLDRDASEFRLYLDPSLGAAIDTSAIPAGFGSVDTNIPLAIGALDRGAFGVTSEFFDGFIDEVVIFDRALSGSEIQNAFDSTAIPEPTSSVVLSCLVCVGLSVVRRRRLA